MTVLLVYGVRGGKAKGLESLKIASLLSSVPHTLVMCFLCVSIYQCFRNITRDTIEAKVLTYYILYGERQIYNKQSLVKKVGIEGGVTVNYFVIGLFDPFFVAPYVDFRRPGVRKHTCRLCTSTFTNLFIGAWTLSKMTVV